MPKSNDQSSKPKSGLDSLRSPLNIGPMRGDITPDYNVPPPMRSKDPLGYMPPEGGGKKRGR